MEDKYLDGGIIANNPSLELLQDIQSWNGFNKLKKLPNDVNVDVGCFLSIGTGVIPSTSDETALDIPQYWALQPFTSINALLAIAQILIDQVAASDGVPMLRAGAFCSSNGRRSFTSARRCFGKSIWTRKTTRTSRVAASDGVPMLRAGAFCSSNGRRSFTSARRCFGKSIWTRKTTRTSREYMYKHQDYVERLCTLLRRVGHAEHRRRLFQPCGMTNVDRLMQLLDQQKANKHDDVAEHEKEEEHDDGDDDGGK
ncbi:hypothetical protein niasHT_008427 [Heterodera trifolii]|uniref:PNPLA domain-containing protein n=1 Tax=Heterodera trifolii TaxID=157864 RepID=A0ABD2M3D2_9BILA